MIQVKQLKKQYAHIEAVKGIDFNVNKGSFFAFLLPNGAGKSTTINMLCTLLEKTSGDIFIDGLEVGKNDHLIRHKIRG
jgi:multidrug/hemolysin transport system ATP-binding protein